MTKSIERSFCKRELSFKSLILFGLLLSTGSFAFGQLEQNGPSAQQDKVLQFEHIVSDCMQSFNGIVQMKIEKAVILIDCIDQYPNNHLKVYNRWGSLVYDKKGYDNTWDGKSTSQSAMGANINIPIGTYYYTLEWGKNKLTQKTGWLYIIDNDQLGKY